MNQVERQKREWEELDEDIKDRWGKEVIENLLEVSSVAVSMVEDPQRVVDDMKHAIASTQPKIR